MRRRLSVAISLVGDPKIVFLDELTTGLDPKARRMVWKSLTDLKNKGLTILLSSHFCDEVEFLCDRIMILKRGEIAFYGTVSDAIFKSPFDHFEDAYLWYADEEAENENI